jgi:alanine racemase
MPTSLRTSLTWKAWLVSCKVLPKGWGISYGQQYTTTSDEIIGVVPVGYGDGFRRFSNNEVLIDGQRVPVVGRVCMDQCMVRLPRRYPLGTEVVLLGKQGNETITADDLAVRWNTTLVDVCAILAQRVERVYVRD